MKTIPQLHELLKSNLKFSSYDEEPTIKLIAAEAPHPLGLLLIGPNDDKFLEFYVSKYEREKYRVIGVYPNCESNFIEINLERISPWYKFWEENQPRGRYRLFHTLEELESHWEKIKQSNKTPEEHIMPWKNLMKYICSK